MELGEGGERGVADRRPMRCEWCRRPLQAAAATGRPRRFCRQACRQRAFEARRRSTELDSIADEVLRSRRQLEELLDAIDDLRLVVDSTSLDLTEGLVSPAAAYDAVIEAAAPLLRFSPATP